MATLASEVPIPEPAMSRQRVALLLFLIAVAIAIVKLFTPAVDLRLPEGQGLFPWADWLDRFFNFIKGDIQEGRFGLMHITRWIAEGPLEFMLDTTANLLYGKNRWPKLGPIPWLAILAAVAVLGYWLNGWRLSLLAVVTLLWTALIGQWDWAMQTMSVLVVAAPVSFFLGLFFGVLAWKYAPFDRVIRPLLAVLQTLPFFTYLLPAVIFFKVGPTAGAIATIIYAMPPMILMTTLGLKSVSSEVVDAGYMSGCSRWQMLTKVYIPAARTEIMVGLNQVIMLCLAMVVLTAFIGMPGLGAKLLAMMNSFKIGRSFEIGVTIVLLAVMLDRLSKAWVLKQPEHFEKATPWWKKHFMLLLGVALFAIFIAVAQLSAEAPHYTLTEGKKQGNVAQYLWGISDDVHRTQDLSQGKTIDNGIKAFLEIDSVQATTGWIRSFLIIDVLIPFRNFMLSLPVPTIVLIAAALGYLVGGIRSALIAGGFFILVAVSGWWDRSVITLYTVISAVFLAMLIGLPMGIWAASGSAAKVSLRSGPLPFLSSLFSLFFSRLPLLLLAAIVAGYYHFLSGQSETMAFLSTQSVSLYLFFGLFLLLWFLTRNWKRDSVMIAIVDTAQTFPSFVYLIPAIMLFGINDVSVIFSILTYTLVPLIRYTIEGLRGVPEEMTEAADMSGSTRMQKLFNVQLPLALPTMAIGFNQAIMFAFFMVIIAAFIGTQDLGQELQRTLAGTDLGKNFVLGACVALMALTFDHVIMRWAEQRKAALGLQ